MNAGFSSLTALKAHLLNESLRSDTTYDAPILSIGLGMASLFDGYLNRKLGRMVGDIFVQRGGKKMMLLPRYPVEVVTQIEARVGNGDPWEVQDNLIDWYSAESGLVNFASVLGNPRWQVRATYTGGFWWPTDGDGATTSAPTTTGATVAITSGARTVAITFASAMASVPSTVVATVQKPSGGANFVATVRTDTITTTGCTVELSGPIPASGYSLAYFAMSPGAVIATDASQPTGSTILPEAIRTAWLLQCEHVWRLRDKLGLSLGNTDGDKPAPGLATLDLIPLVQSMLKDHIRFVLN